MAIKLTDKPNTTAPDGDYPFGDIRDNDGSNNGTPVNRVVYGDLHQFLESLMFTAGITFNGLLDNATNGFQYLDALIAVIRGTGASFTQQGTVTIATQAQVNTGTDTGSMVAPATLKGFLDIPWIVDDVSTNWSFNGGSGSITFNTTVVKYKIIGKTMHVNYVVSFDVVTNTVANIVYTFTGISRLAKLQIHKPQYILQGSTASFESGLIIQNVNPMNMVLNYKADTTQFPVATSYLIQGEFTVEIV